MDPALAVFTILNFFGFAGHSYGIQRVASPVEFDIGNSVLRIGGHSCAIRSVGPVNLDVDDSILQIGTQNLSS